MKNFTHLKIIVPFLVIALFITIYNERNEPSNTKPQAFIHAKTNHSFHTQINVQKKSDNSARITFFTQRQIPVQHLYYQWKLPANIQVISGDLSGEITDLKSSQHSQSIEIQWENWPDKQKIIYEIYTNDGGIKVGKISVWNPFMEDASKQIQSHSLSKPKLPDWVKVMQ